MIQIKRIPNSDDILIAVKANEGYCPCKLEKNPDTKCMCKEFIEQKTVGDCECGLYTKVLQDETKIIT